MLNMQRQIFPLIDTSDFKKILNNLHKNTRRTDITLTNFKNEIVKMIGYDNFSHFSNSVLKSKQIPQYADYVNNHGFNYSNGGYLIYLLQKEVRKLLGIPVDLYTNFLDEQMVRFTKKKPFLVINGSVYFEAQFDIALKCLDNDPSSRILLCLAHDKNDALTCYSNLLIEDPFQHIVSFYDDSDIGDVRDFQLSHLQPNCASPAWVDDNPDDLQQLKRPDIALKFWAENNKSERLLELLDIAKNDTRFSCRIYLDEFNSNCKFKDDLSIKAHRLFTLEINTPDGLLLASPEYAAKHYFDEDITAEQLRTADSIVQVVNNIKSKLVEVYGPVSIYIISNGVSLLESCDRELVIPLSEVLRGEFFSDEHRDGVLKSFGIKNLPNIWKQ